MCLLKWKILLASWLKKKYHGKNNLHVLHAQWCFEYTLKAIFS